MTFVLVYCINAVLPVRQYWLFKQTNKVLGWLWLSVKQRIVQ